MLSCESDAVCFRNCTLYDICKILSDLSCLLSQTRLSVWCLQHGIMAVCCQRPTHRLLVQLYTVDSRLLVCFMPAWIYTVVEQQLGSLCSCSHADGLVCTAAYKQILCSNCGSFMTLVGWSTHHVVVGWCACCDLCRCHTVGPRMCCSEPEALYMMKHASRWPVAEGRMRLKVSACHST